MNELAKKNELPPLKEANWLSKGVLLGIVVLAVNGLAVLVIKNVPALQDATVAYASLCILNLVLGAVFNSWHRSQYAVITAVCFLMTIFGGLADFLSASILVSAFGAGYIFFLSRRPLPNAGEADASGSSGVRSP